MPLLAAVPDQLTTVEHLMVVGQGGHERSASP